MQLTVLCMGINGTLNPAGQVVYIVTFTLVPSPGVTTGSVSITCNAALAANYAVGQQYIVTTRLPQPASTPAPLP